MYGIIIFKLWISDDHANTQNSKHTYLSQGYSTFAG